MRVGSLVVTKTRWSLDARYLGLVVEKTLTGDDTWLVLWSLKDAYKLQEHLGSGLSEIASRTETCNST